MLSNIGGSGLTKLRPLRFRTKILLGFGLMLAISTSSMGAAYLGFERASLGMERYRQSVAEADLARSIDRDLTSYSLLAERFLVTGKDDDGKTALVAETRLKDAVERSVRSTSDSQRLDRMRSVEQSFLEFSGIFARILKIKETDRLIAQNELVPNGNSLRYKLDELASIAADAELATIELVAKQAVSQFQAAVVLANTFVINLDKALAANALTRLKFIENSLKQVPSANDKVGQITKDMLSNLAKYQQAIAVLTENSRALDDLTAVMVTSATAINEGVHAINVDLVADQSRLEADSKATIGQIERLIAALAAGGFILGFALAFLLGNGIAHPIAAMCSAMRELAAGRFNVVLPSLGRTDELGEIAAAVEEFKIQAIAKS